MTGKTNLICQIRDLGIIGYKEAYVIQKQYVFNVLQGESQILLLCEHPTVLTLGRLANEKNILISRKQLENKGVEILYVDRGGDITLHCPGQLVIYPILNLAYWKKDLKFYIDKLEEVAVDLLHAFGIVANRIDGRTGVWVQDQKIVSIGIGVKKWVSFHGLAVNVNTDLKLFSMIKPCGLDVRMTTMAEIKNETIDMKMLKEKLINSFCRIFHIKCRRGEEVYHEQCYSS